MSRAEIISEIPKLSHADRQEVMRCLLEIEGNNGVDLPARGIDETQAAELCARLKTFASDWDPPEADIYDQDRRGAAGLNHLTGLISNHDNDGGSQ